MLWILPGLLAGLLFESGLFPVVQGQRPATNEEFPFQVSIRNSTNNAHLCGGVILTSKWILTVRECARMSASVLIGYGNSDSNQPLGVVANRRIIFENEPSSKVSPLALIELESEIKFSNTVRQSRLPRKHAKFFGSVAKLSGWKVDSVLHKHPSISVIDKYKVNFEDCKTAGGIPIQLAPDQFCGIDEEFPDYFALTDLGTTISKDGIVMGLLPKVPDNLVTPIIFVKVSEHDEWIQRILGPDGNVLIWADTIPKDSAESMKPSVLFILLISTAVISFAKVG